MDATFSRADALCCVCLVYYTALSRVLKSLACEGVISSCVGHRLHVTQYFECFFHSTGLSAKWTVEWNANEAIGNNHINDVRYLPTLLMAWLKKGSRRKIIALLITFLITYAVLALVGFDHYVTSRQAIPQVWCENGHKRSNITFAAADAPANASGYYHGNLSDAYRNGWVGFRDLRSVDCGLVFNSSVNNSWFPQEVSRVFPHQFLQDSTDCDKFIVRYGFFRHPEPTDEERNFPIAFIILFYSDLDQVLFFLRSIYRPHNVYCLSVDTKASVEFLDAVRSTTRCLPNVFVSSHLESVVYAGISRLVADIRCMEDLLRHSVRWRYVINMPGQQFPLRSNLELVNILKLFNGANDVEGITGNRMLSPRYIWRHDYVTNNRTGGIDIVRREVKNGPPPHGLEVVKGSAYGTFSRNFTNYVINDPVARDFLEWNRGVCSPDEYFWATLHHSKVRPAPGGFTGVPDKKPWLSAYASWGPRDPCATKRIRSVCIFSPEDLPQLVQQQALFANKFYVTHHPAALHCLDQFLFNLSHSHTVRDLEYYRQLPFIIKNQTNS